MEVFLFVFLIALAIIALGFLLLYQKDDRLEKIMPYLISISAGVLIGLCLTEFLYHSFEYAGKKTPFLIAAGILFILLAEKFLAPLLSTKATSCESEETVGACITHKAACSSIGCIIICAFFDGIEIVAGFQIHDRAGFLTGIGMALHAIPSGALAASLALAGRIPKKTARAMVVIVALALISGALLAVVLSSVLNFNTYILPVASGVLLYISFGHLLPVSTNLRGGMIGLFFGLAIVLLLSMGHIH